MKRANLLIIFITISLFTFGQKKIKLEDNTNASNFYFNEGKVGIGVSNPMGNLQIYSNEKTGVTTKSLVFGSSSDDVSSIFKIKNHGEYHYSLSIGTHWGASKGNNVSNILCLKNGQVGILTENPRYSLDVLGIIRAEEIKVDLDGADFVFEDDYRLRSLEEVESFITKNKHLPEIEPASKMKVNGTDLGDLNSKLLQKIEELTLYMIEVNKEMKALKKKNEELQILIDDIKKNKAVNNS